MLLNRPDCRIDGPRRMVSGVSLIEVLVALLVVSLGVLAMSGLLATASRFGKTSEYRAVATLLASDMADRMRANAKGVVNGDYELTLAYSTSAPAASAFACDSAAHCDPAQMADKDLADWRQSLHDALPGGAGYINVDNVLHVADLWVAWLDPEESPHSAYVSRADDPTNTARKECPPGFQGATESPRCLFFRVAL